MLNFLSHLSHSKRRAGSLAACWYDSLVSDELLTALVLANSASNAGLNEAEISALAEPAH